MVRMFIGTLAQIIGAIVLVSISNFTPSPSWSFQLHIAGWGSTTNRVLVNRGMHAFNSLLYGDLQNPKQRLDTLLRLTLYVHFSGSLNGISTIRAYRKTTQSCAENAVRIDVENWCMATFCEIW